jgi:hypothetical protein
VFDDEISQIYIPKNIGIRFKKIDELISLIKNKTSTQEENNIDYFFNNKWKENYINFLTKEIGLDI